VADWLIDPGSDPLRFPVVRHRHANGTITAERQRTPADVVVVGDRRIERWAYACACGEIYVLERRAS
jgi:hypothetical protein